MILFKTSELRKVGKELQLKFLTLYVIVQMDHIV